MWDKYTVAGIISPGPPHKMKATTFRITEKYASGETGVFWQGSAYDADHALEKAYDDGGPGSLVTLIIEYWGRVEYSRELSGPGWVHCYTGPY